MSARRAAASLGLCVGLGALGVACPAQQLSVDVTESGVAVLSLACRNYDGACGEIKSKPACNADLTCKWDLTANLCRLSDKCLRAGNPDWTADSLKAIEVLLIADNPVGIKARSRCVPLVRATDPACLDPAVEVRSTCAMKALNQAIDVAIQTGLAYGASEDPATAFPAIAIYQPSALPAACQAGLDTPACARASFTCPVAELVSCAGLGVPVNHSTYDITCASCQNGLHFSVGVDTGPCPVVGGACFFDACAAALGSARGLPAQ